MKSLVTRERKVAVIGLGYVGLPIAVAFGRVLSCIGYDISSRRIGELIDGFDRTREIAKQDLISSKVKFTSKIEDVNTADFYIVCVPTPITKAKQPDLSPLISVSEAIGKILKKGDIVVFESTVYPGVTEDICQPILESVSGLKGGKDFKLGYSPERVNPGDKQRTVENIMKIVSGQDNESLEIISSVYSKIVKAGIHRAPSIKVAEAAKVIENTQRDLNIALMNELSLIFDHLDIDTQAVLDAAQTKWNFLRFQPGLVGGHCIGVDPYYLTYRAEEIGYHPQVILAGRRINDSMASHVAHRTVKAMIRNGLSVTKDLISILGVTFKENCPDIRNSKVLDLVVELQKFGAVMQICDPHADPEDVVHEFPLGLTSDHERLKSKVLIVAVAHDEYKDLTIMKLRELVYPGGVIIDIKSCLSSQEIQNAGYSYWRL